MTVGMRPMSVTVVRHHEYSIVYFTFLTAILQAPRRLHKDLQSYYRNLS